MTRNKYLSLLYFCLSLKKGTKENILHISCARGHSQTTLTSFWLFLITYPPPLTFLWYKCWQKINFFNHLPPALVNIVCECPLTPLTKCFFASLTIIWKLTLFLAPSYHIMNIIAKVGSWIIVEKRVFHNFIIEKEWMRRGRSLDTYFGEFRRKKTTTLSFSRY